MSRIADHQVHVEGQARDLPQGAHDGRANRDVRHEVAVHHVHVDVICAGGLGALDFLGQASEVSGQYGWGDLDGVSH
jgi:hypothetical protein